MTDASSKQAHSLVQVLGTAQDGGFPHAGCSCVACESARTQPALARRVSCIGLVGTTGKTLIVDATPDFSSQMADLSATAGQETRGVDAIVLTHAHIGHYLGLALLGREAMSATEVPVYCTPSMARFLRENRPWSHLVKRKEILLQTIEPGKPLNFDGITVHAFLTPHRGEDTDTIGLEFEGPERRLIYVSDADVFPPELARRIREADVALIDGTFYDRNELPNREILAVRHPFVKESLERFVDARGEVIFIHLNHSNALLSPEPPALPAAYRIAREGEQFAL
jgi:pyrroloquinoline quinone biosynthesis protein B